MNLTRADKGGAAGVVTPLAVLCGRGRVLCNQNTGAVVVLVAAEIGVGAVAGLAGAAALRDCGDILAGGVVSQGRYCLYTLMAINADAVVDQKRVAGLVAATNAFR